MSKPIVASVTALALSVLASYAGSGWWTGWCLERSLHRGDLPLVTAMVNEGAVRAHLAGDLSRTLVPPSRSDWLRRLPEGEKLTAAVESMVNAGSEWMADQIDAPLVARWLVMEHHRLEQQSQPVWRTCTMEWDAVELCPARPRRSWGSVVAIRIEREEGWQWRITHIQVRPLDRRSPEAGR